MNSWRYIFAGKRWTYEFIGHSTPNLITDEYGKQIKTMKKNEENNNKN